MIKSGIWMAIAGLVLLSGCVGKTLPVPEPVLSSLSAGQAQVKVHFYERPHFRIMSVKSVAGDGLAAIMSKSQNLSLGDAIMEQYRIPDPARMLTDKFVGALRAKGIRNLSLDEQPHPQGSPNEVPNFDDGADYSLIVRLGALEANYLPLHWQTYAFTVQGDSKLVRKADGKVIWQGVCFESGYKTDEMKLDVTEFEKDDAAKVKELIERGTDGCSKVLVSKFLAESE